MVRLNACHDSRSALTWNVLISQPLLEARKSRKSMVLRCGSTRNRLHLQSDRTGSTWISWLEDVDEEHRYNEGGEPLRV